MTEVFLTLTEVFPCFFLSCKANARVKLAKTGHGPHSSKLVIICVVRLLFVLFYVLFVCKYVLPPGDNPIAVNKYIISYIINHASLGRPTFLLSSLLVLYISRLCCAVELLCTRQLVRWRHCSSSTKAWLRVCANGVKINHSGAVTVRQRQRQRQRCGCWH